MEFATGGCRDAAGVLMALFLLVLLAGVVAIATSVEDGMTAQAKARSEIETARAESEAAQVRYQESAETQRQYDQLTHELAMLRQEQANYEQRLGTLAVALAGLDSGDAELLVEALEAAGLVEKPKADPADRLLLALAVVWAVVVFAAGLFVYRNRFQLVQFWRELNQVDWMDGQ